MNRSAFSGRRLGELLLKILGAFLILEPVWMLLPFAGFLYGSVFQIQTLSRDPATAWLTHFVFPVLTLGPLGPVLTLLGLVLFLVGAVQIYTAKFRRSGLVTNGLYRFVRHPQYVALTLFGLGILLTWGRAIAYVAFAAMMFLYYWLAKVEERRCREAFGEEYETYRKQSSFLFPGDRVLAAPLSRLGLARWPLPIRVVVGMALAAAACFGSMVLIDGVKTARRTVPCLQANLALTPWADDVREAAGRIQAGERADVPFVHDGRLAVVRGPWRAGAAPGFAERILLRIRGSRGLREPLAYLKEPEGDCAVAFVLPSDAPESPGRRGPAAGGETRGPPPSSSDPDRIRLLVFRVRLSDGSTLADVFSRPANRTLAGAVIAPVNAGLPHGSGFVKGLIFRPGPRFPAEERWTFLLDQLAEQRRASGRVASPAAHPGGSSETRLVLVKAPILRTRRDPEFAREILDRLVDSAGLRRQLERVGAGRDLVPVAFPRPGPNWYREHHGVPQISVFVMLVRPAEPGAPVADLFRTDRREIVGAFTIEMDFAVPRPGDSLGPAATIGPYRDLEERWTFFLSGL